MPTLGSNFRPAALLLAVVSSASAADGPAATRPVSDELDAPTRVTLKYNDAPPREAFAALGRQAGVILRTSPKDLWDKQADVRISLALDGATFWSALRELCQKSGLTIQRIGNEGQMVLTAAPGGARQWVSYPSSESGPYMVVAQTIKRDHQVDLAAGENVSRSCTLTLGVYAEPKLKILKVSPRAALSRAVDENGVSLTGNGADAAGGSRGVQQVLASGQWVWTVSATLAPPQGAGQAIATLEGSVTAVAQTLSQTIELDKITEARNVTRQLGGHRLLVKELRRVGTGYTLTATITRDPASGDAWQEVAAGNMLRLVDAEGRSLTRRSYTNRWGNTQTMDLSLSFGREDFAIGEQVGEPVKLIWEVPQEVKEIRIPFVFTSLPLP